MYTSMWADFIALLNVSMHDMIQLLLIEDQQVIQALSAGIPPKAFTPRRNSLYARMSVGVIPSIRNTPAV
jgi:hypothetical protein